MEILFILLLVAVIFGFINIKIAEKNGRDKTFAFLMGLLFGWVSTVVYLCMGQTKELRIKEMKEALK